MDKKCGICNCDLESKTPNGETIYVRDSNQNHEIESDCDCWFCTCCLEWLHHITHPSSYRLSTLCCRRCGGDITQLVQESCDGFRYCECREQEIEHSDCPECERERQEREQEIENSDSSDSDSSDCEREPENLT